MEQLQNVIRTVEHDWASKSILVLGDLMLDKYIWGEVARISPEAPVPVVLATHETQQPGGAANVAMILARLGARARVVGFTGSDENASHLADCIRSNGIEAGLVVCSDFPTITKLRILGGRQQMLRLDTERNGLRADSDYDRLIETALALLSGCDAIVLSDYAKGVLTPRVCQTIIQAARKLDIPVLVDPKSTDFSIYRGATTICPNLMELAKAAQVDSHDLNALLHAAEAFVTELDLRFLIATLSEKGIALVRQGSRFIAPAEARQVFDVSGAGDTVIAVMALCLACGLAPETGVQLANIAAGIVVGRVGTVPVERHELMAALTPEIALHAKEKVVDLPELLISVGLWKRKGETVVFTNGCFDLLHVGHITVLEQARSFGQRLIVAVNSDASVRGLKGPGRPIVSESERARVLAALAAVDAVVIFDQPTPIDLITAIQPDILVKGGDYTNETVVGAKEAAAWGGQVRIVPTVDGFSTTNLIQKGQLLPEPRGVAQSLSPAKTT